MHAKNNRSPESLRGEMEAEPVASKALRRRIYVDKSFDYPVERSGEAATQKFPHLINGSKHGATHRQICVDLRPFHPGGFRGCGSIVCHSCPFASIRGEIRG